MKSLLSKNILILLACISICNSQVAAQCTEFWGVTTDDADPGVGTIFKTDGNGDHLNTVYRWHINEGSTPSPELCKASNGKYYGITRVSTKGYGSIFEWDPVTEVYTTKFLFLDAENGIRPSGSLMQARNGKLYGMTYSGGENNNSEGVLFEWDPIANIYIKKYDLKGKENGRELKGTLMQADNGKLYGITRSGGLYNVGVLFEYDPDNNIYTKKVDFDGITGIFPESSLVQANNGKLYGMTKFGGENGQENSFGVLFEWDPCNDIFTNKWNFNISENGSYPTGSLVLANNGKLYGMTSDGGNFSNGVIFEWDPNKDNFTKKIEFSDEGNGRNLLGSLTITEDGKFYGTTSLGGVVFEWDTLTNILIKKGNLADNTGRDYTRRLIQADRNRFFGTMQEGGISNSGVLFEWNYKTNIYTKKYDFYGAENGNFPGSPFIQATNGKLYGVTTYGGTRGNSLTHGIGVLYEWDPVSQQFAKKIDFGESGLGICPIGPLTQANNIKIYGTASLGGLYHGNGTIYEWDLLTNQFTKKFGFGLHYGLNPQGSLVQAKNGKLFGMATGGSFDMDMDDFNNGEIYEWDPTTDTYTKKIEFTGTNGRNPNGSLVMTVNGKFYGVTQFGGMYDDGVLFEWDPVTNIYTKKIDFGIENGEKPDRSLLLANNGKIYGVTSQGGENDKGTLFEWDTETDSLVKKIDFNDGINPQGTLMQARNGNIYGVTYRGGTNDAGILYEWDPVRETYSKKYDFKSGESGTCPIGLIEIETNKAAREHTFDAEGCGSYISPSGRYIWTTSGECIDTIPSAAGCDSIITVNLTIQNSSTRTLNSTACNSYISPSGKVWTTSGEYKDTIPNAAGCDSIITVHLTIKNSTTNTISQTACDNYTSPSGKVWTNSGEYKDTILNTVGCDSVITLNLTIANTTTSIINESTCDSYTSPSSNYNWTTSGEYKDTIPNALGCDSVITVNLTIVSVDTSVTQYQSVLTANAAGASFQWIGCDNGWTPIEGETSQTFSPAATGPYAVIISQNGCIDTSACFSVNITGFVINTFKQNITLYPNPNDGSFSIDLGKVYSNVEISICELDGRIYRKDEVFNSRVIDLQIAASPGMYMVIISSDNERAVFKVMKK